MLVLHLCYLQWGKVDTEIQANFENTELSKVLSLMHGVGQNIAKRSVLPTAKKLSLMISTFLVHSTSCFALQIFLQLFPSITV